MIIRHRKRYHLGMSGGIVQRFGAYTETTLPGLHWHLPFPIETVTLVNTTSPPLEPAPRSCGMLRGLVAGAPDARVVDRALAPAGRNGGQLERSIPWTAAP